MKNKNIKLIAIDLDGTTLKHVGEKFSVSPRVRAALDAAKARGVQVVISTGRGVFATREFAKLLGVNAPAVCHQGGVIHDFITETTLFEMTLPISLACELVALEVQYPAWHAVMYRGENVYITRKEHPDHFYDLVANGPIVHADLCAALEGQAPEKVLFIFPPDKIADGLRVITEVVGDRAMAVQSHPMFVEVNPLGAHKGAGLAWLARHMGIAQEHIMAIGDQGNDITMIEWAGLGVAMGNGNPLAKQVADWIAPTIDEDGAAVAIEKFVLNFLDTEEHGFNAKLRA